MVEIVVLQITRGNVDDRVPVPKLTQKLEGKIFADKGYIKQNLFVELFSRGLQMIHPIKKKMYNKFIHIRDRVLLKKRVIVETVLNCLKNQFQLVHTRHRSPTNAFIHILSTIAAYSLRKNKPRVRLYERIAMEL